MKFDDDVNGIVIGECAGLRCGLYYNGRKQSAFFAENREEAIVKAEKVKHEKIAACGEAAIHIYPADTWELRIYE